MRITTKHVAITKITQMPSIALVTVSMDEGWDYYGTGKTYGKTYPNWYYVKDGTAKQICFTKAYNNDNGMYDIIFDKLTYVISKNSTTGRGGAGLARPQTDLRSRLRNARKAFPRAPHGFRTPEGDKR